MRNAYDVNSPADLDLLKQSIGAWLDFESLLGLIEKAAEALLRKNPTKASLEQHSEPGYARRSLNHLSRLRVLIAKGDALRAAEEAFYLGAAFKESQVKFIWESAALRGKKVKDAAKLGGRQHPGRDAQMAREFVRRRATSRLSKIALAEKIGESYGLKRRAAWDAVKRGLKIVQDPANCTQ